MSGAHDLGSNRAGNHRTTGLKVAGALLLLMVAVALGACVTSPVPPPKAGDVPTYRVGAPDDLIVSILPEPVIERAVTVRPDGRISIDLIGDVRVSGKTPEEIAADIRQLIAKYKRDAVVTVTVALSKSSTVTLFGMVTRPGIEILDRETRVAEAVGMVGGANIFASKGRVRVVRSTPEGTKTLAVNLRAIEYGDQSTNYMLRDGDIVVVPPNAIARVGFALQTLLFPFQQVLSAGGSALIVSGGL